MYRAVPCSGKVLLLSFSALDSVNLLQCMEKSSLDILPSISFCVSQKRQQFLAFFKSCSNILRTGEACLTYFGQWTEVQPEINPKAMEEMYCAPGETFQMFFFFTILSNCNSTFLTHILLSRCNKQLYFCLLIWSRNWRCGKNHRGV